MQDSMRHDEKDRESELGQLRFAGGSRGGRSRLSESRYHTPIPGHVEQSQSMENNEQYAARSKASESERRLEAERRKTLKYEEKIRRRKARGSILSALLTPKTIPIVLVGLAILISLGVLFLPGALQGDASNEYLSSHQLERAIGIDRLSSARYVYNGIAEVCDEGGNVTQRIYYSGTVRAGVDMSDIEFEIDNERMTVMPLIPEITVSEPSIDESSFDYMPSNPNLELNEIIQLCKADATSEINRQGEIYETAESNLRMTIEGLTLPLIENTNYELIWPGELDGMGPSTSESNVDESGVQASER